MEIIQYLERAVSDQASDVFIVSGAPVSMKLEGHLCPIGEERLLPPKTRDLITQIYTLAERSMDRYLREGDDDFAFAIPGLARFRVSAYRQRGSLAAVVRIVSFSIPDWQKIHIPQRIMDLADTSHGIILMTGTAGSGKSTTQACIIDRINQTRDCHIITLEDPIEFLHRDKRSIISQREIAVDTKDYASALQACLRQAPDVILLGEIRDPDTIQTTITAAETGHLIIATLHTKGAVNSIDRIIDGFPASYQNQIRTMLSMVLKSVVSQQMVPDKNGEMIPVFEVMHVNSAIRSMIRENKNHQIANAIASGGKEGMISMDQALIELYREGAITRETALEYADAPDTVKRQLI